ncbi:hypothetical protein OE165_27330, partial [Escherichia coli]|uniref:hypothetical protein n=1 Tax=Escherichia coli TaxID=562 RepID=UPI0021F373E6
LADWTVLKGNPIIVADEIVCEIGINGAKDKLKRGNGVNRYLDLPYLGNEESESAYGILIDNRFTSPIVTRIGNLELHKTLPIQSNMKG